MSKYFAVDYQDYRKRVMGCWLGKAIGGTLGMPHEGKTGPLGLTFYDPVPTGALPNDDLDLQVLWLVLMQRYGIRMNRRQMGEEWLAHVDFPWDEYGAARANFSRGIFAPASGHQTNCFGNCMGSPIRSEIWACLAPGDPELACRLAYEDAIQDHDGEGIWGEQFFAAVESAAFVIHDRDELIRIGLAVIPPASRTARAVKAAVAWFNETKDWKTVRENIIRDFGHPNFTDAPQNIAITVLGWLSGKDFGDAICTAVNCGQDADCTGATLGSILGIIDPAGIPEAWKKPISSDLILSNAIKGINPPRTLEALTDLTAAFAQEMLAARSDKVRIVRGTKTAAGTYDIGKIKPMKLADPNSVLLADGGLRITAVYPRGLNFVPGKSIPVTVEIENKTRAAAAVEVTLSPPAGWKLTGRSPSKLKLPGGKAKELAFTLSVPKDVRVYDDFAVLKISQSGVAAEYRVPFVSCWPWMVSAGGKTEMLWLPERTLLPAKGVTLPAGQTFQASTSFHFPRRRFVRVMLASNGAGQVRFDGRDLIRYDQDHFVPAPHRPKQDTVADLVIEPGWHQVEVSLTFPNNNSMAVILFADGYDHQIICDLTANYLK
jgi:ADP-ribosylglycohydrolase